MNWYLYYQCVCDMIPLQLMCMWFDIWAINGYTVPSKCLWFDTYIIIPNFILRSSICVIWFWFHQSVCVLIHTQACSWHCDLVHMQSVCIRFDSCANNGCAILFLCHQYVCDLFPMTLVFLWFSFYDISVSCDISVFVIWFLWNQCVCDLASMTLVCSWWGFYDISVSYDINVFWLPWH